MVTQNRRTFTKNMPISKIESNLLLKNYIIRKILKTQNLICLKHEKL